MTRAADLLRTSRFQVFVICLIGLALRLGLDAKLAPLPWPDSRDYLAAGRDLLHSGQMTSNIRMPLYPLFLAGIGPHYVIFVQALLSSATAVIAYYLAREIFQSSLAASLAGLLGAFDPVAIFYADQRLSETLFIFLFLLSLLTFYRHMYVAGSIAFVLSLLVRPTFDLLAIPLIVAFVWLKKDSIRSLSLPARFWRHVAKCVAIYIAIYVVLMSPWWWHNYEKYGTFVRLDLADGIMARMEQSPEFARHGFNWQKLLPITNAMDNVKDPVQRDAQLRRAAVAYIREHPLRYVKLCVYRFGRFWSPVIDQDDHFAPRKVRKAAFAMTVLLYALSLFTLASAPAPEWRKLLPLLLVIFYLMTVQILTQALPRYRVPIEPLLYVLASGAILRLPYVRTRLDDKKTESAYESERN